MSSSHNKRKEINLFGSVGRFNRLNEEEKTNKDSKA